MNNDFVTWLKKHDLLVFFLMIFLFTWPRSLVNAAVSTNLLSAPSPVVTTILTAMYLIGTPMLAALLVTVVTRRWVGVRDLFARVFRWRVGWQWYAVVLLVYPMASLIALTLSDVITGSAWSVPQAWRAGFANIQESAVRIGLRATDHLQILAILFVASLLVPLFEELGWRAFAIPRMLEKTSSLFAALMMGLIWAFWHLPSFFTVGTDHYGMPFSWFLLITTAISTLMVWVMNHANQSVLLTVLFHTSIILAGHFIPTQLAYQTGNHLALWLTCVLVVGAAIIVILYEGPQLGRPKQ